jgi:DNA-binding MarR family transcriptional regulator
VDQANIKPSEIAEASSVDAGEDPSLEQVCESIWKTTEEVLELLRSHSSSQIQKRKRPDVLWVDDVTRAQGNTVIALKQLTDENPDGVTLKKLSETIGVTPAAASVMVDLLVSKKMIKRTRSKNDRRAILLRLTPQTARLFEISDECLGHAVMTVRDVLGPQVLRDWQRILETVSAALRQTLGPGLHPDDLPDDGAGESTAEETPT